jgi:hypothetical protein
MNWAKARRWGVCVGALAAALSIGSCIAIVSESDAGPVTLALSGLLPFVVIMILIRVDVATVLRSLPTLGAILPVFAFSLVTLLMGQTSATHSFDEIGAQVIVVLLLALAIDARFFRLSASRDRLEIAAVAFTMMVLAVGEYYALRGLLSEEPRHAEMIAGAIAAGFAAVAVTAMAAGGSRDQRPRE